MQPDGQTLKWNKKWNSKFAAGQQTNRLLKEMSALERILAPGRDDGEFKDSFVGGWLTLTTEPCARKRGQGRAMKSRQERG